MLSILLPLLLTPQTSPSVPEAGLQEIRPAAVSSAPLDDPIPRPITIGGQPVRLETVTTGMVAPNWGTFAPGMLDRLFVTDQAGTLWSVDLDSGAKSVFLDVSDRLVPLGVAGPGTFDERGLLGVAFHPAYAVNGLLYTYTSEPASGAPDFQVPLGAPADHEAVVTEWRVPDPGDPSAAVDPGSARVLLRVGEPQFNHDGGAVTFGPDGMLYVSLGDGGSADDQGPGHASGGNGQATDNVLGTVLRIDPLGNDSANGRYGIPADNPFAPDGPGPFGGDPGCLDGSCDEIFAFGLRNPFRISFDRATGDLFVADVGQNDVEEIDVAVTGGNHGWPLKEGSFCFDQNGSGPGFVTASDDCEEPGLVDPVAEYDHDEGIAVIGGFVYRGAALRGMRGRYVFGEFTDPGTGVGRLLFLNRKHLSPGERSKVFEARVFGSPRDLFVLGMGQDADGELYVLGNRTGVPFGATGVVQRIVPVQPARGAVSGGGS